MSCCYLRAAVASVGCLLPMSVGFAQPGQVDPSQVHVETRAVLHGQGAGAGGASGPRSSHLDVSMLSSLGPTGVAEADRALEAAAAHLQAFLSADLDADLAVLEEAGRSLAMLKADSSSPGNLISRHRGERLVMLQEACRRLLSAELAVQDQGQRSEIARARQAMETHVRGWSTEIEAEMIRLNSPRELRRPPTVSERRMAELARDPQNPHLTVAMLAEEYATWFGARVRVVDGQQHVRTEEELIEGSRRMLRRVRKEIEKHPNVPELHLIAAYVARYTRPERLSEEHIAIADSLVKFVENMDNLSTYFHAGNPLQKLLMLQYIVEALESDRYGEAGRERLKALREAGHLRPLDDLTPERAELVKSLRYGSPIASAMFSANTFWLGGD